MSKKLNDGHYFELMDRLYLHTCTIEDYLLNHPVTKKSKKLRKLINVAGMSLAEAYQIVGHKSFTRQEKRNGIQKVILRRHKNSSD